MEKRGQGRPVVGENDVGRERMLKATEKILRELPPARVTGRVLKADAGATMLSVKPLFLHLMVLGTSDFFASAEPLIRELVPGNTNMEIFATRFQEFLVRMVIDGLRKTEIESADVDPDRVSTRVNSLTNHALVRSAMSMKALGGCTQ